MKTETKALFSESCPTLSKDVSISEGEDGFFVIEKHSTSQYFRTGYPVYCVITLIEKGLCKQEILEQCGQLNLKINEEIYFYILKSLFQNGILESDTITQKKRVPIYFRVKLLSENRINNITTRLKFLFKPRLFPSLFLLSSFCTLVFVFKTKRVGTSLYDYSFSIIAMSMLLIIFLQVFHEIGHATASATYGIETKEIGMGFFYGVIPVFYSNLSKIWILPANKRIIANLGGIYFDVLLSAVCIAFWYITNMYFFLLYPYVIFGVSLKNVNIFMRYDGYWVVADILRSHNLLQESKQAVMSLIRDRKLLLNMTKTRAMILLVYGILSYVYVVFFMVFVFSVYFEEIVRFPQFVYSLSTLESLDGVFSQLAVKGIWKIIFPLTFYVVLISKGVGMVKRIVTRRHL